MAAADVLAPTATPAASFKPIIANNASKSPAPKMRFDAKRDLAFETPERVVMMEDIGYNADTGISPVAVSQPFRLFTRDAVQQFRDEALNEEVLSKCCYKSTLAACQVRGHAPKYAPFTYDAWYSPETLSIISKIAGVDLVPVMDAEIGHVNISVKSEEETKEELAAIERERQSYAEDEGIAGCPWEDDKPVVGWHVDAYPFVCVTMLSDCTNMVGGETAVLTGDGSVMKVRGPSQGCAVVMQGRYLTHQGLRALGAAERITMVTSFRPKSPHLPDDSDLINVRGVSDLSDLYFGYGQYRLEIVEERIRAQLKRLREAHAAGKKTDARQLKKFLEEQEYFLRQTDIEIVPYEEVVAGKQPEAKIGPRKVEAEKPAKRSRLA